MPTNVRPWTGAQGLRPDGPFVLNRQSPQARGLVAWVPMAGASVFQDRAGIIPSVSMVNGPTLPPTVNGRVGAFAKASDQYLNLGIPPALDFTGANNFTLSMWYTLASVPGVGAGYQLITKDKDTGGRQYTMDISAATGLRGYTNGGTQIVAEGRVPVAGDTRLATFVVSQAAGLTVYVNAASVGNTAAATLASATANTLIGRREYTGFTEPFDGNLWDARIYNRALSPAEVWALYDPRTRFDLYAVPSSRVFMQLAAAGAFSPFWAAQSNQVMGGAPC